MIEMELDSDDEFDRVLIKLKRLHDRKRADYSAKDNRFSNFEYAAKASGIHSYQIFEVLIGIKQARLLELMGGRSPLNESLEDTLLDRAVYCILAYAYYVKNKISSS